MKLIDPLFINAKQVQAFMDNDLRSAYRELQRIRRFYNKEPTHRILFVEFFEYKGVDKRHIPEIMKQINNQLRNKRILLED